MRRADREVKSAEEIRAIFALCKTCHVAMVDEGMPYVVPLSFGYELQDGELTLFFHSAKVGRKMIFGGAIGRFALPLAVKESRFFRRRRLATPATIFPV